MHWRCLLFNNSIPLSIGIYSIGFLSVGNVMGGNTATGIIGICFYCVLAFGFTIHDVRKQMLKEAKELKKHAKKNKENDKL